MQLCRSLVTLVVASFVFLSACACKEGNPITGGIAPAQAAFVAEDRPANVTSDYVSLRQESIDGGRVYLDVVVTDVDQAVTGIALKLTYPDAFSKFVACSDGDLFPPGQCHFAEPAPESGDVFIGRTITAPAQATTVSGDVVIVRLEFLVFGKGDDSIVIEGQNLGGSETSALQDENGDPIFVEWYSGRLRGE